MMPMHRLRLGLRLVDRVDDAEIMLGVLVIRLAGHPVAAGGGIPGQLGVFLVQLLGGAALAHLWPGAVEDMVAVERDAVLLVAGITAATAAAIVRAVVAATHTLHVHVISFILKSVIAAARQKCRPGRTGSSQPRIGPRTARARVP